MPPLRCLFALLVLGLAPVQAGFGQAWVQPKGHAYVKLSHSNVTASEQYRFDGQRSPYADNVEGDAFFDESLYLYGVGAVLPQDEDILKAARAMLAY